MPRLRPLNFDLIAAGNEAELSRAFKDLLMLYPRGPGQRQKKEHYVKSPYSHFVKTYLEGVAVNEFEWNACKAKCWGYTSEQFYTIMVAMGIMGSGSPNEWDFKQCVRNAHPEWSQHKITRGSRRLVSRMSNSWDAALAGGKLGDLVFETNVTTHEVPRPKHRSRYDWNGSDQFKVYVPAKNAQEAEAQVQVMFGHAGKVHRARGWEQGDAAQLMVKNNESIASIQGQIERQLAEIEAAKAKIENLQLLKDSLELYTITAFDGEDN